MAESSSSSGGGGSVIFAGAPPMRPKGLVEAVSEIEQVAAVERRGGRIDGDYFTLANAITFFEVGFKAAFVSGLVSALFSPLAIAVVERMIPAFGDSEPSAFDQAFAFALAVGFPVGYAFFMASLGREYAGPFSRKMIRNLLGGAGLGAAVKAAIAVIFFHFAYIQTTPARVAWALGALDGTLSTETLDRVYYAVLGLRPALLTASWFVVMTTAAFLTIPAVSIVVNGYRNRRRTS
ncbi:MAG: hypothetical protein ACNS63_04485 [Candidatus Nitrospinota bacterium M3_3B_026]